MAVGGTRAAGDDHDVRRRPQAGQELRHALDGRGPVAGAGPAVERSPRPSRKHESHERRDDPARTIAPRLIASGADLTKVHILESVVLANGTEALPSLRADIDAITAAAVRLGDCRLIVIDPVSAYLRGVDDNRNAACAECSRRSTRLAERLGAAVVLVSHLTKTGSGTASIACWARSPMSGPVAPTIGSSPTPTTPPAGAS